MFKKIISLPLLALATTAHSSEFAGQLQYKCIYNYWSEPGFEAKALENGPARIDYITDIKKDKVFSKRGDKYSQIDYSFTTDDGGITFIQEAINGQSFITLIGVDGKSIVTHNVFKNGRTTPILLHGKCTIGVAK